MNYVTADGKTNWAEGSILIAFYAMIVRSCAIPTIVCTVDPFCPQGISAWYYSGQNQVRVMNSCTSVASALVNGVSDEH